MRPFIRSKLVIGHKGSECILMPQQRGILDQHLTSMHYCAVFFGMNCNIL